MKNYPIENRIHASIINHCKDLQDKGVCVIDGGQLAKTITTLVTVGLLTEQQQKIYRALTEKPKDAKTISKEIKVSSVTISIQLRHIYKTTQLLSFKKDGRIKLLKYFLLNLKSAVVKIKKKLIYHELLKIFES